MEESALQVYQERLGVQRIGESARSCLVMVVIWFLGKEGLSKESRLRRGRRDEETRAARSRKGRSFEHQLERENVQI